jgi:hypothetical protein
MSAVGDFVVALAEGRPVPGPITFLWGVHEGLRGATWTELRSDGMLKERKFPPGHPLGKPLSETVLAQLSAERVRAFAQVLVAHSFDRLNAPLGPPSPPNIPMVELTVVAGTDTMRIEVPAPQMDKTPGLTAIRDAFLALRAGPK